MYGDLRAIQGLSVWVPCSGQGSSKKSMNWVVHLVHAWRASHTAAAQQLPIPGNRPPREIRWSESFGLAPTSGAATAGLAVICPL